MWKQDRTNQEENKTGYFKTQSHLVWSAFIVKQKNCYNVRHPLCVFINYNWINQLSNTTIWCLDICCLLHRYQLYVTALMTIFRLRDWQQTCKQLYFGMHLVFGEGGLGLDGGTSSRVCCVWRVMWVHGYYCANLRLYSLHLWYWILCVYVYISL